MSLHPSTSADEPTGRPKRKCSVQPIIEDQGENEAVSRKLRTSSPAPIVKTRIVSTPLRISIPEEENCKLSDDLADSCKTLCKICGSPINLTNMRSHTMLKHELQITKYKDLYGPFEIIEKVFHKCHLCGKILLLDSDAMGGHIKGTHKMKEKEYKERFMTYSYAKAESKASSTVAKNKLKPSSSEATFSQEQTGKAESNIDVDSKDNSTPSISKPQYDFKTTFPDFEYSCNLKHCELCEHGGVNVLLETLASSEVRGEVEETLSNQDTTVASSGSELVTVEESCSVGQGGWSKKFLPTDILVGGELDEDEDENDHDENFNDKSFYYSDESLLEESADSSSDNSSEDDTEED